VTGLPCYQNHPAVNYTIVETCKMTGLNPQAYLADIIHRIADHLTNKIDELLPWNWTPRS
jgi:transposase